MRLIDADALKNKVLEWMPSDPCEIEEKEIPFETDIVVSLMMEIEEAPTIEQPIWIPCIERLPERDGDYLATFHHKWPDREYKTVEVEEFRSGKFDENLYMKVVAWTPLPEPWKGAEVE